MKSIARWFDGVKRFKHEHIIFMPDIAGIPMALRYRQLRLAGSKVLPGQPITGAPVITKLLVGQGEIPECLVTDDFRSWGGESPDTLYVRGTLCCADPQLLSDWLKRPTRKGAAEIKFVAQDARADHELHSWLATYNLLFGHGFTTSGLLCTATVGEMLGNPDAVAAHKAGEIRRRAKSFAEPYAFPVNGVIVAANSVAARQAMRGAAAIKIS